MTQLPKEQRDLASGTGTLPAGGFAPLVPELDVTDIAASLDFWCALLGFSVAYDRPAAKFAYLEREGAQIMLCQINGNWDTGILEKPFGRGINFEIKVNDIAPAQNALAAAGWPLFRPVADIWYRPATGLKVARGSCWCRIRMVIWCGCRKISARAPRPD
jgi:catechol 2,3-dioxygenase-like lactoylglutathione lyase family enzyme